MHEIFPSDRHRSFVIRPNIHPFLEFYTSNTGVGYMARRNRWTFKSLMAFLWAF